MGQKFKKQSGQIKCSLHSAVLEETFDKLEAAAKRNESSMGEIIDSIVEELINANGNFKRKYKRC